MRISDWSSDVCSSDLWHRDGTVAIDFASDEENALARPFVLTEDGRYRMWFAHKGEAYRLGYAESDDGIRWQRDDSFAGVAPSASGWDSQIVEYAAVARQGDANFMFSTRDNNSHGGN